jgi:hypothetical protein
MPELDPRIQSFQCQEDLDCRVEPGNEERFEKAGHRPDTVHTRTTMPVAAKALGAALDLQIASGK